MLLVSMLQSIFPEKGIRKFPNQRGHISYFYFYIWYSTKQYWEMCEADIFHKPPHPVEGNWVATLGCVTFPSNGCTFTGIGFDGKKEHGLCMEQGYRPPRSSLSSTAQWGLLTPTGGCKGSIKGQGQEVTGKEKACSWVPLKGTGGSHVVYFIYWNNFWKQNFKCEPMFWLGHPWSHSAKWIGTKRLIRTWRCCFYLFILEREQFWKGYECAVGAINQV